MVKLSTKLFLNSHIWDVVVGDNRKVVTLRLALFTLLSFIVKSTTNDSSLKKIHYG